MVVGMGGLGDSEPSESCILSGNTAVENSQHVQDSYLFQIYLLPPDPCFWVEQINLVHR